MTDDRSLERAARSWLAAGPTRAPATVVEAALARIEATPQDADWHLSWTTTPRIKTAIRRVQILPYGRYVRYAVLALALFAVMAVGLAIAGRRTDIRYPTQPPFPSAGFPSAGIANPSRTPRPTPTPRPQVPLTKSFTSTIDHYAISFPDGWTVKPATKESRYKMNVSFDDPTVDVISAPDGRIALYAVSQVMPAGMSFDTWAHTTVLLKAPTLDGCPDSDQQGHDQPLIVGGISSTFAPFCSALLNLTPSGDRGYMFDFYPTPSGTDFEQDLADQDLYVEMLNSVAFFP